MNLFDLVAVLTLNKKDYDAGLDEAEKEAGSFGDKLKKGFGTATKVATAVTGVVAGVGAGVVKMASSSASAMDEIDKSSQKMGVSAEAYQEWAHAMDLSGMSIDTMKTGMKTLQTAMAKNDDSFASLGISLTDASGNMRSAEDVMNDAIMALSDMEEGAERTALANKLFGRAGVEMAPLLNQGSEAIKGMKQEAHDLGLVMSGDDVKAGAELNDTLNNLKKSFGAIITKLGNSLMPIVKKVADMLMKFLPKISDMFDRFAPMLLDLADQILPFLMELAETLLPVIFDLLDTIMPVLTEIVRAVLPIIQTALEAINPLLKILTSLLKPVLDIVNMLLKPLLDLVNWVFGGVVEGFNNLADSIGENGFLGLLGGVAETVFDIFGGIGEFIGGVFETIGNIASGIVEGIKGFFQGCWNVISGIFDKIKSVVQTLFGWIGDLIEESKEASGFVAESDAAVIPATGGVGNLYNKKPHMARGGILEKGQTGFLEGNGAEAVVPLENNYKWIHAVANDMKSALGSGTVNHTGTITVKGVNNQGEFVASADYVIDELLAGLRQDARLAYG